MKICVVGLGVVGLPTVRHINKYHEVLGLDIDPLKLREIKDFPTYSAWEQLPNDIDVFIICVNTWWRNNKADMSAVEDVSNKIANRANEKTLVIIESTVSVGTSRRIFEEIFHKKVLLANCPHRYWPGDPENYGVKQLRTLGAANRESIEVAKNFYSSIEVPIHPVSSFEAAEISKIAENSYRFIEIAYAEELALTCQRLGIDFNEVRQACNTLKRTGEGWQVQIMEAKEGIGGTCLPKDIRFLQDICNPGSLIEGAMKTDDYYRKRGGYKGVC